MTEADPVQPACAETTSLEPVLTTIREALARQQAVYPQGGRTKWNECLLPMPAGGMVVDTTPWSRILDYPARDMTITVQAGIRMAELQSALAQEGQWLPIDVPHAEQATLGGCLACNTWGPRVQGYGSLRDYVIGIQYINAEGQLAKAGGRVVKNVAGYDLCKLLIGSRGTLGIITQVTLKVRPLPQASGTIVVHVPQTKLGDALFLLNQTRTQPASLTMIGQPAASPLRLEALFEGSATTVAWQLKQLIHEFTPLHGCDLEHAQGEREIAQARVDAVLQQLCEPCFVRWRCQVLPSQVLELWPLLQEHASRLIVYPERGTIIGQAAAALPMQQWQKLKHEVERIGGQWAMLHAPDDGRLPEWLWGSPRPDWKLMRRIKQAWDPKQRFSPGRFFIDVVKSFG